MVSTRSKTAQTHLEDFVTKDGTSRPTEKQATPPKKAPKANSSRKRKSTDTNDTEDKPPPKRTKTSLKPSANPKDEPTAEDNDSKPIIINRAPVLQLWAASIAHFTYPRLSWETCLSVGSAVSSICAVTKGRSIGTVPEIDESNAKQEERKKNKNKQKDLDEIEIMHFKLKLKEGLAIVGSGPKGKPGSKDALKKKFGEEQYEKAKDAFDDALKSWKGEEDELNKKAFHFYEQFRPDVSKGQKGWGRKGELSLETVKTTVQKG